MKLVYLSNYYNHHQKPLADALYSILGKNYSFIATREVPEFRKALGYQELSAPYVLYYNHDTKSYIESLIEESDVVIYGEAPLRLIKQRLLKCKLTLRDDECRYRSLSRYLKWPLYTYASFFLNRGYLLCASAYAPIDYILSGMKLSKCFKWGYFPEVKMYDSLESVFKKHHSKSVSILWCGRLIPLKHPESIIYVADKLKRDGFDFEIKVIGTGDLENSLRKKINKYSLQDTVKILGAKKSSEVRMYMEQADIFMFTSDRNEGWGAVLNESMNSGCAVVAGSNIGSVPYLINHGVNGLIFKSDNWESLYENVKWLIENPDKRAKMGIQAYLTIVNEWNGVNAANKLLDLCKQLLGREQAHLGNGPCSPAPLIIRTWRGLFKTL